MSKMNELDYLLKNLPRENLINLMFDSLALMQQYNGRSRYYCVVECIGGKIVEQDDGREIAELPSLAEAKRITRMGSV